jgi:uncharacterized damage-inducible protein DinB
MAEKEHFQTLFGYNDQANRRMLDAASKVSVEDYFAENEYGRGSLHSLLFHILRTEYGWRTVLLTGAGPNPHLGPENFPDLPSLAARWPEEAQAMRDYLTGLDDAMLAAEIAVTDWRANVHHMKRWFIMQHLILHGMQHRSEAAVLLTRDGQSPGNIDFIYYQEA